MPQELVYFEARLRQSRDLERLATDVSVRKAHQGMIANYLVEIAVCKQTMNSKDLPV